MIAFAVPLLGEYVRRTSGAAQWWSVPYDPRMTDEEVLVLLARGNSERAAAKATFEKAYASAESEIARCWAAHMVAVVMDRPEEKLRWNLESLRAAETCQWPRRSPGGRTPALALARIR